MEGENMKKIFVVGAGRGLGNGVAEKFANENFQVILISRSEKNIAEYKKNFAEKNISIETQAADVTDFENFAKIFKNLVEKFGTPDVLFYNVGITTPDDENLNAKNLVEHYISDVAGAFNCIKLLDTKNFSEKNGAILITGGGLAIQPYAGYLPLSMDKAALRAMVQALTPVLKEKNIFIGTVQVTNVIGGSEKYLPKNIAEEFWKLYKNRDKNEIIY